LRNVKHAHVTAVVSLLALIVAATEVSSAPQPMVVINWADYVTFSKYHSYIWVERPLHADVSRADADRVRALIDRYLASRGFKKSEAGDFAIAFHAEGGAQTPYQGSLLQGGHTAALSIDIYDTSTKRPIWSGRAAADLGGSKVTDQQLEKAIERLLTRFPPSHGCSHLPADTEVIPCPSD
jgi:hypothetical protein